MSVGRTSRRDVCKQALPVTSTPSPHIPSTLLRMPDPPDKLDPKMAPSVPGGNVNYNNCRVDTDMNTGSSASPTPTTRAVSTATPAPAQTSKDEASTASPPLKPTSRNQKLKTDLEATQHEVAELRECMQKLKQENEQLRKPPPTVMAWLAGEMEDRFRHIIELQTKASELFDTAKADCVQLAKERAKLDAERQAWDAQMQVTTEVAHLNGISLNTAVKDLSATAREAMEAEVQRLLTYCLRDDDTYKAYADAEVAKVLADRKAKSQQKEASVDTTLKLREDRIKQQEETMRVWYEMLETFDLMAEDHRRKKLADVGKAAPPDERKYALSDPAIKNFANEKYLAGYIDCVMAFELRQAVQEGVNLDPSRWAYLNDPANPKHPYQIGKRIGQVFGWRALCHMLGKPEWDHSLDTHKWTWEQFWTVHDDINEGGVFDGTRAGFAKAEKDFEARQTKEAEKASFQSAAPKEKGKQRHQDTGAAPEAKKPIQPRAASNKKPQLKGSQPKVPQLKGSQPKVPQSKGSQPKVPQPEVPQPKIERAPAATSSSPQRGRPITRPVVETDDYKSAPKIPVRPRSSAPASCHDSADEDLEIQDSVSRYKKPLSDLSDHGTLSGIARAPAVSSFPAFPTSAQDLRTRSALHRPSFPAPVEPSYAPRFVGRRASFSMGSRPEPSFDGPRSAYSPYLSGFPATSSRMLGPEFFDPEFLPGGFFDVPVPRDDLSGIWGDEAQHEGNQKKEDSSGGW